MKNNDDPRHLRRVKTVQDLFAFSFNPESVNGLNGTIKNIVNQINFLDELILKAAPQFPVNKIARIDVSILRLALFELFISKSEPPKVIIDEAIELAKELGGESSSSFINGVLGSLVKKQ
ncbi:hypothetical protein A2960_02150 [Candidatus Gottesmanbacteria bacterium RIFCSPLOWO2_01_FULL_39_12b]|uniref:NusB/RsmB/TIM44 domain-containing protein n=1 Tax=Candidatus Gottesmanbacteria bacterium RIFCSPLOWO2_01_FULL_39_12b TaxID=1798388 RepID=A0A1F6AQF7_9BACT|nr:MAG: hypothetical protein A2960_02150 [Candidatus Gottesmanbacteria bacterium RIFCSPLOWO2_01_FULL_39_12b]